MKRIIPFVAAVLVALSSQAQTVNVNLTNGQTITYNASQVDYIDFTKPIPASGDLETVDLGLPSGTKWANMNVGATAPDDYGLYFAWGEIQPKEVYDWDSYQWGSWSTAFNKASITKYNNRLNPEDDAATINWGGKWRMPTKEEFEELVANTTVAYETIGDSAVVKLTSKKNGASIYMPLGGWWNGRHITYERQGGYYWASTLSNKTVNKQYVYAYCASFLESNVAGVDIEKRPIGQLIRPVIAKDDKDAISIAPGGAEAVDMGLSVLWANMNVGAEAVEEWGNFYSWGETVTRNEYGWYYEYVTGKDSYGNDLTVTTTIPNYKFGAYNTGFTGYSTAATVLESVDDAATANWGDGWCMPTKEDFKELLQYTTYEKKKSKNGVWGGLFTSTKNGKSIFLPAGGYYDGETLKAVRENGAYYSSTVNTDDFTKAFFMGFKADAPVIDKKTRTCGFNVRAVKK